MSRGSVRQKSTRALVRSVTGTPRGRPAHLAVVDARDRDVHERVGGGVEEDLVDLELDLVAAALLVGDAGEQVELLAHLLPGRERVQELALLLDDRARRRRRPRTAPRRRPGGREHAEGKREHLLAREFRHGVRLVNRPRRPIPEAAVG